MQAAKKIRSPRASVCLAALVGVLFLTIITLSFGPWIASQETRISVSLKSPMNYSYTDSVSSLTQTAGTSTSSLSIKNNASTFYYVGASTSLASAELNQGIRSFIQVRTQNINDGVLSFWISEAFSNNMWAQAGYYIDNGSSPTAFYQIWNLSDRVEITTGTEHVSEGIHLFSIVSIAGTNEWNFSLDSKSMGSFEIGTNISSPTYPIYAMSEEGYSSSGPFSFNPVLFQSAIQVYRFNAWSNASSASSFGSDWGLQGHAQNPLLGNDQITVGKGYEQLNSSSSLWA